MIDLEVLKGNFDNDYSKLVDFLYSIGALIEDTSTINEIVDKLDKIESGN